MLFISPHEYFQNPSCAKLLLAWPNCDDDLIQIWKFSWHFWNCEALSFAIFPVNALTKIFTHYRWLTTLHFIVNVCLPIHLWTFSVYGLQFLRSLHLGLKELISCWVSTALSFLMSRKRVILQIDICRINRLEGRVFLENYGLCNVSDLWEIWH
jgi:hypothetical protein